MLVRKVLSNLSFEYSWTFSGGLEMETLFYLHLGVPEFLASDEIECVFRRRYARTRAIFTLA